MKKILILLLCFIAIFARGQNVHYDYSYMFSNPQATGLDEYVASTNILLQTGFMASSSDGSYFRFRIGDDPNTVYPANYVNVVDPDNRQLDYNLPVGTIPGYASVTPGGAAQYDIPVIIPPGTNGMQPSVSVSYNSQIMNGLLGKGWNLNAVSVITRSGSVQYIDGEITGISNDLSDHYSLDGQRLVWDQTSAPEGTDGSNYSTEIESFSDVHLTVGQGVSYFIVKTKDGKILEYGNTEDSRLLGAGSTDNTVVSWYLNKVTDANGNYMNYRYRNIDGECVLDRIEYTGNEDAGILPYNVIKFNYSERLDKSYGYTSGKKLNQSLILNSIEIRVDFTTKLTYVFNYAYNGFSSSLQEIVLNDENDNHYNSLIIDWEDAAAGFTFNFDETDIPRIDAMVTYSNVDGSITWGPLDGITTRWPGDFNGDGLTDILEYKTEEHHYEQGGVPYDYYGYAFRILINDNQGGFIPSDVYKGYRVGGLLDPRISSNVYIADIDNDGDDDFFAFQENHYTENLPSGQPPYYNYEFRAFEYSGNQINELTSHTFIVSQSESDHILNGTPQLVISDFDGDLDNEYFTMIRQNGLSHFVGLPISGPYSLTNFDVASFQIINFNGNAKMDILISSLSGALFVYEYDESTNTFVEISDYSGATISNYYSRPSFLGDYNGDGLTDILCYTENNEYRTYISNGLHFIDIGVPTAEPGYLINHGLQRPGLGFNIPGDYNGDGLTDLVIIGSLPDGTDNFYVAYNKGNNIFEDHYLIRSEIIPFNTVIAYTRDITGPPINSNDFDGDGKNDIYAHLVSGTSPQIGFLSLTDPSDHVLMEGVKNGLNMKTSFEYDKTAGNPDFYEKTMNNTATTKSVVPVTRLVKKMVVESEPADFETEYSYKDLLINTEGKGMLGYANVSRTSINSGIRTESFMSINPAASFPYLSKQEVYLTHFNTDINDDKLISETESETVPSVAAKYGFYPIQISSTSTDHRLKTKTEVLIDPADYDMYGNTLESTTNVYDLLSGSEVLEQTVSSNITYNYNFTSSKHILGLPSLIQKSYTKNGMPAGQNTQNLYYYPDGNLWKSVSNPASFAPNKSVTTELLGYNDCGLPTIKIVSAPYDNLPTPVRTESWEYDTRNRFVVSKTDDLGNTSYFFYNRVFGSILHTIDIQGNTSTSTYDNFGTLVKSTDYLGQITEYYMEWNMDQNIPALYYTSVDMPNSPNATVWYDGNGREVKSCTNGLNAQVFSETEYDAYGRVYRQSLPHFVSEAPRYSEYSYYDDSRIESKTYENLTTSYTYNARTSTVTKPDGKTESSELNALGQLSQSTDNAGTLTYSYNSAGEMISMDNGQSTTEFEYDQTYHWRTKTISPDLGEISFEYYASGELYKQTDAKGNTQTYTYDVLGRVSELEKFDAEHNTTETITYTYVPSGDGVGQINQISSDQGIVQSYTYDQYGRMISGTENIQGKTFTSSVAYNDAGQVETETYPSGFEITNLYNGNGYLNEIQQTSGQSTIWKAISENALGQRTHSVLGSNIHLNKTYDLTYNTLSNIDYSTQTGSVWQQQYSFDPTNGNLNWRSDVLRGMTEDFGYDNMDRLETIDLNNGSLLTQNSASYYANGNIQTRSDVGLYSYSSTKPHALVEINDPVGQLPEDQSVSFNATSKILDISQGFYSTNFTYGPDDMRRKMEIHEFHNLVSTRYYQGAYEEEVFVNGNIKKTHYISSPDGINAMMIEDQTGSHLYYLATDFLGSICGLMDANGNMVEEYSYDSWGGRRNPNDWSQSDTRIGFITDRGFTGHEMLTQFGLINMNGRVYDPAVGRFLSPDPIIQQEGGSQNMNSYSYALNNPLKYTDPTGYRTYGNYAPATGGVGNNDMSYYSSFTVMAMNQWSSYLNETIYSNYTFGGSFNPSGAKIKRPTRKEWKEYLKSANIFNAGDNTVITKDLTGLDISIMIDVALAQYRKKLSELFPAEDDAELLNAASASVPEGFGLLPTGEWIDRNGNITLGFTSNFKYGPGRTITEAPSVFVAPWVIYSSNNSFITIVGHEIIHFNAKWKFEIAFNDVNSDKTLLNNLHYAAYGQPEGFAHTFSYQYAHDHGMRYPYSRGLEKQNFDWTPYLNFSWLSL